MIARKRTTSLIPVRIGALLVNSGILRSDVMQSALNTARQSGRMLGEVLIEQNLLSEPELRYALDLQKLIREGSITVEMGARALRQARDTRRPVSQALEDMGWKSDKNITNIDLAEILYLAGCVSKVQIEQAKWNSEKNCLPLGRNLILTGAISPSTLGAALNALVLIRNKKLEIEPAAAALKQAIEQHCALEEILDIAHEAPNHVRIGDLLAAAGALSESDAMIAVENGLINQRTIGQVLLQYHMVTPLVLDSALKLQAQIQAGRISREQAAGLLRGVVNRGVGIEQFVSEMAATKTRALELLLESQVISEEYLQHALQRFPQYESDMVRALIAADLLTEDTLRAGLRCVYAMNEGSYTKQDAINWLRYTYVLPQTAVHAVSA